MSVKARTIGKLAKETGVNVETVRYYERRGLLLQPEKIETAGFRHYDEAAVRTIRFIKRAQALGFTLEQIRDLMTLRSTSDATTCDEMRRVTQRKIEEVERKIADLTALRNALIDLKSLCESKTASSDCPILEAIQPTPKETEDE